MKSRHTARLFPALLLVLLVGLMAGCTGAEGSPAGSDTHQAKEYQDADQAMTEIEASLTLINDAPTVDERDSDSF